MCRPDPSPDPFSLLAKVMEEFPQFRVLCVAPNIGSLTLRTALGCMCHLLFRNKESSPAEVKEFELSVAVEIHLVQKLTSEAVTSCWSQKGEDGTFP